MKTQNLQQAKETIQFILSTPRKFEDLSLFERGLLLHQGCTNAVNVNLKKLVSKLSKIGFNHGDIMKLWSWRNEGENGLITWGMINYMNLLYKKTAQFEIEQVNRQLESFNQYILVTEKNYRSGILSN